MPGWGPYSRKPCSGASGKPAAPSQPPALRCRALYFQLLPVIPFLASAAQKHLRAKGLFLLLHCTQGNRSLEGRTCPKSCREQGPRAHALTQAEGPCPHQGPCQLRAHPALGASRLQSLGTLGVFGLASRSLCHETIFPSMGLGQGWDLDWGLGFVSRGGPRSGGIWRGFLSTATTPSPATSLHFPGTPSKHIKPLLRLQGGACIFGFQSVKANAFGHIVRHNFQDLYLASFFQGDGCSQPWFLFWASQVAAQPPF